MEPGSHGPWRNDLYCPLPPVCRLPDKESLCFCGAHEKNCRTTPQDRAVLSWDPKQGLPWQDHRPSPFIQESSPGFTHCDVTTTGRSGPESGLAMAAEPAGIT